MPIPDKVFKFNVGELSNRVVQQLDTYKELPLLISRIHISDGATFNQRMEEVVRLWYQYTLDHMLGVILLGTAGEYGVPEPVTRFVHRRTRPEMDDLYRIIKIPEQYWRRDPQMQLLFSNKDLILKYVTER